MSKHKEQAKIVAYIEHAIFNIKFAAAGEQKLTHAKHICPHYRKVLDELDLKLTYEDALLKRYEILGQ